MSSQSTLGEFDAEPAGRPETSVPDQPDPTDIDDDAAQEAAGWVPTTDDVDDDLVSFNRERGQERTELGASVSDLVESLGERRKR